MASLRTNSRIEVGSASWISEERASALQFADAEAEEFSFSARNELDWLNEHMAEIFSENQLNVAEIFKTPGKLRGKTPRTARKANPLQVRAPLSDVFSTTPHGGASPLRQQHQPARQTPRFQVAEDTFEPPRQEPPMAKPNFTRSTNNQHVDSGYHGSQGSVATVFDENVFARAMEKSPAKTPAKPEKTVRDDPDSDERRTTEGSFKSAKEEQTVAINMDAVVVSAIPPPKSPSPLASVYDTSSPSPRKQSPMKPVLPIQPQKMQSQQESPFKSTQIFEDVQSPSDGSSPIRPIVRKSSLNFAGLPPREPLTTRKSGARISRTSNLDQSRTSYYGRHTGGKSIGGMQREQEDYEDADVDMDEPESTRPELHQAPEARLHTKTYTQRLQDQISMLGQSQSQTQAPRPSKSIPNIAAVASQPVYPSLSQESVPPAQPRSPVRSEPTKSAPGAFPEDEEDSWIGPPTAAAGKASAFSPRPILTKSNTTAVMDGFHRADDASGFNVPKQRSPVREFPAAERSMNTLGHFKSSSTSVLRSPNKDLVIATSPKKGISVSNPNVETNNDLRSPPKSPSRSLRDSPLKAAKDKISSILKTSRGLFASSAAVSAEAYSSVLSPPSVRPGHQSLIDLFQTQSHNNASLYPSLDSQIDSPSKKGSIRKTRASAEREKREEKEAKEARIMNEQLEKLERQREKESQKARVFSQEQERVAAMKKQVAAQKEQEKQEKLAQAANQVESPRATRSSPRKTKAQLEAEGRAAAAASTTDLSDRDVEMTDASSSMPPPAVPRLTASSQMAKPGAQLKRLTKPGKELPTKSVKQAPLRIRVQTAGNAGPARGFHPSNTSLASSLGDSLAPAASVVPTQPPNSLHHKPSTSSLKSVGSINRKPPAIAAAARKKEQDELAAQRRKDEKLENQRKRVAAQEEEKRQEQQRQEAERQREKERIHLAHQVDAHKTAQRQAMNNKRMEVERAKLERPPPRGCREGGGLDSSTAGEKPLPTAPAQRPELGQNRPPQRMNSTVHRSQEDLGRSMNSTMQNSTKAPPKRHLPQDMNDDYSRPPMQRNGPSYTQNAEKRRRTGEDQNGDMEVPQRAPMAPPIRQSAVRQPKTQEVAGKSMFSNGYATVPQQGHGAPSLLHQATRTAQQAHQTKAAHPMDLAHTSKATINFAPNPSQPNGPHKTPARPVGPVKDGKSTVKASARSSPRFQEQHIELPEIHTDSEDDDSDAGGNDFAVPDWANSPNLRSGLMQQETMDPALVFGKPGELKMEEVFKNKERWGRFRQRTSSANWSGNDRLTEEEVKTNLEARERLRREGGWSYGLS